MSFFDNLFKLENETSFSGLNSELKSIYIYEKFKNLKKSITVVTNSVYEANNMYKSLLNYSKDVYISNLSKKIKLSEYNSLCKYLSL